MEDIEETSNVSSKVTGIVYILFINQSWPSLQSLLSIFWQNQACVLETHYFVHLNQYHK